MKPASILDTATSSTNDHAVPLGEMTEDESKDVDGNKVAASLTRRTGKDPVMPASSSDTATSSTNDHAVALGEIKEDESMGADGKNVVTKSLTRIRTGVGAEESQLIGRQREILGSCRVNFKQGQPTESGDLCVGNGWPWKNHSSQWSIL